MNEIDRKLIEEFMRLRTTASSVVLEVGIVEWPDGPHHPVLLWKGCKEWRRAPTAKTLVAAKERALANQRHFQVCRYFGERNNVGHMWDAKICQSCAERYFDIVF